jgi:hypothetical protein
VITQTVIAQLESADQCAVYDQIGITADRRGKMRVTLQRQAEMPDILGAVGGLRHAAQHDIVDQRRFIMADHGFQQSLHIFGRR